MSATIIKQIGTKLSLQVEIDLSGGMLEMEEQILSAVNELGGLITQKALESCDTKGELLQQNGRNYSSKGREKKST